MQGRHHQFANMLGRDIALGETLQLADNAIDGPRCILRVNITLAKGNLKRALKFVTLKDRPSAISLDDRDLAQLHTLKSGKTSLTPAA
jgi:hypothetical protein